MNIGIDLNTKETKATVFDKHSGIDGNIIFEVKNVFAFAGEDVFVGSSAINKFITEKKASIYNLDQIVELNGLIINKRQVGVEKCLSIIFDHLLKEINKHHKISKVDLVCVSIPYDKFYLWMEIIPKAFSHLGIEKVRVISQPAAFFANSEIKQIHKQIHKKYLKEQYDNIHAQDDTRKEYDNTVWYKKIFSQKPEGSIVTETGYLFISTSTDNSNISLVTYEELDSSTDMSSVISTKYTEAVTENLISSLILKYIVDEIGRTNSDFLLNDNKTIVRLQGVVDEILKLNTTNQYYELNLPYLLCRDGQYKNLNWNIDLRSLLVFLSPTFDELIKIIIKSAEETQEFQKEKKQKTKIGNIILVGSPFIQKRLRENLLNNFIESQIILSNHKSLTIGALNFSKIITGDNKNFLALEVVPFSISIRLLGGQFVEMVKKDTTIPTMSKEHCFQINNLGKAKFIDVQLTTTEGLGIQSLSVWKVKIEHWKAFRVQVNIEPNMKISLKATPQNSSKPFNENEHYGSIKDGKHEWELEVQKGDTFSFNGSGFEMGMKGKDLRQYILNQFNYLNTIFGEREFTVFEPDNQFYSFLKSGDPFSALRHLGVSLKLKSLPDVELSNSTIFEEQGVAGFISGKKISIPQTFVNDPQGFGYVLAHELAHYILIHEEGITLDSEQENEILTEIFVIYCGMGKLFLNGFNTNSRNDFASGSRGYLDEKIITYIHQIYFEKFNLNKEEYMRNLTSVGKSMLE